MQEVDPQSLDIKEQSRLVWVCVQDAVNFLLEGNPKLHDIGTIIESIVRYGWQDKPRYDETLGAIKHGNGRMYALYMMEKDGRYDPPRGIAVEKDTGAWWAQIEMGIDAATRLEAIAYTLDANNLTITGAEGITPWDVARMYESGYTDLLGELAAGDALPASVGEEDWAALVSEISDIVPSESGAEKQTKSTVVTCPHCGHEFVPNA